MKHCSNFCSVEFLFASLILYFFPHIILCHLTELWKFLIACIIIKPKIKSDISKKSFSRKHFFNHHVWRFINEWSYVSIFTKKNLFRYLSQIISWKQNLSIKYERFEIFYLQFDSYYIFKRMNGYEVNCTVIIKTSMQFSSIFSKTYVIPKGPLNTYQKRVPREKSTLMQ